MSDEHDHDIKDKYTRVETRKDANTQEQYSVTVNVWACSKCGSIQIESDQK